MIKSAVLLKAGYLWGLYLIGLDGDDGREEGRKWRRRARRGALMATTGGKRGASGDYGRVEGL